MSLRTKKSDVSLENIVKMKISNTQVLISFGVSCIERKRTIGQLSIKCFEGYF